MKLRYEAPKGLRIKSRFRHIAIDIPELWCFDADGEWYSYDDGRAKFGVESAFSNYKGCHSVKAFRRFARKHPQFKGKMCLVSIYYGHDVYA